MPALRYPIVIALLLPAAALQAAPSIVSDPTTAITVTHCRPDRYPRATLNSCDTIVSDMQEVNDLALAGINQAWASATATGRAIMGNDPRGTNTPWWWQPDNLIYKSSEWWNVVIPWFGVFDAADNMASNTRVQVRRLQLYVKSLATGAWIPISYNEQLDGWVYIKDQALPLDPREPDVLTDAEGALSILPPGGNLFYHGWSNMNGINASDVVAVFATMQARLVIDNESLPDDRAAARYLVHVGADYYPTLETRVSDFTPDEWNPGVGIGRAKLVTNDWRAFNFCTIADVGVHDPGGGISVSELLAAPPPLE